MGEADSQTMTRILVEQDCCGGGMSHGTACVGGRKYPRHIAARDVNPRPNITVVMVAVGGRGIPSFRRHSIVYFVLFLIH